MAEGQQNYNKAKVSTEKSSATTHSKKRIVTTIAAATLSVLLLMVPIGSSWFTVASASAHHTDKAVFVHYAKKGNGNGNGNGNRISGGNSASADDCGSGSRDYNLMFQKPSWSQLPVPYYVDTTGLVTEGSGITAGQANDAVVSAFNSWNDAHHANRDLFTPTSDPSQAKVNVSWQYIDGGWGILAQTTIVYFTDTREIISAEIVFDSADSWYIGEPNTCSAVGTSFDVEDVAAHEIGHALGLDHVSDPALTMYPYTSPGETLKRTLGQGDERGLNKLY